MIHLTAIYYDGRSSAAWPAELVIEHDRLVVKLSETRLSYALADIRVAPAVGRMPRRIDLPHGAALEVADGQGLAQLLAEKTSWLVYWESRLRLAALAVPVLCFAIWAGYRWGLPLLADAAAPLVPVATERWLAEQTLALLDERWLHPSRVPPERQLRLRNAFARLQREAGAHYDYRLDFRRGGPLGANAFALPGGQLVMTDELVALARNDMELLAVLAHEMGHVEHRHGVKGILRSSGLGIAVAMTTGDVSAIGGGLAGVPLALAELRYSRDLERDADDFALQSLTRSAVSPCHFPAILERLSANHKGGPEIPDWMTSHPQTRERMQRFDQACSKKR